MPLHFHLQLPYVLIISFKDGCTVVCNGLCLETASLWSIRWFCEIRAIYLLSLECILALNTSDNVKCVFCLSAYK